MIDIGYPIEVVLSPSEDRKDDADRIIDIMMRALRSQLH